jgi:hypothetical protein
LERQYQNAAILLIVLSTIGNIYVSVPKPDWCIVPDLRTALGVEKHYSLELPDLLLKTEGQTTENLLLTPTEAGIVRFIAGGHRSVRRPRGNCRRKERHDLPERELPQTSHLG